MVQPLTKVTKTGDLYTRSTTIEAAILAVLALDRTMLESRAAIADRNSSEYIPSECLVHLIRKRHREANALGRDRLLEALLRRCAAQLGRALPDGRVPNAAYIRDEALGRLGELFAEDGLGDNPDELDYFEVRFNSAFAALRTDLVRAEYRTARRFANLPEADDEEGQLISDDEAIARLPESILRNPARQEDHVALTQMLKVVNGLPPDQREAVVLCHIMGYEEESDDPTKITAATRCGVTGRTIRNRLRRAAVTLKRYKGDL
jgi:hypothetical protein